MGDLYRAALAVDDIEFAELDGDYDEPMGQVSALVSAYDVEYQIGHKLFHTIKAGAFAEYKGTVVPLFWQHAWDWSERTPIGVATADETDEGLVVTGTLWLDIPEALAVWRSNKAGALTEWSIGYGVRQSANEVTKADGLHLDVTAGELLEASSVLRGANPATRTLQTAAALWKQMQADNKTDDSEQETTPAEPPMVEGAERLLARKSFRDLYRPQG